MILWDESARVGRVSCAVIGHSTGQADTAIEKLASAMRSVLPGREVAVRVSSVGIIVAPRPTVLDARERWGKYRVTLLIEGATFGDDAEAPVYVSEQLAKMQRFENASFSWDASAAAGTFSMDVVARSGEAADGEARDALDNLLHAAVAAPGEFSVQTLKAEWLSEAV